MDASSVDAIADALIAAYDGASTLPPISAAFADFDVDAAYAVLRVIEERRRAQGWRPAGRKIGFTNRTIWPRYGVYQPMWAHTWTRTVHDAPGGRATLSLSGFVQARIEPEVVFGINAPVGPGASAREVLDSVDWIAPGFEVVQSHFPAWKFTAADCTAAFGLHGGLVIGTRTALDAELRDWFAERLPTFELTLSCGGAPVDRGRGDNVLGSPALALRHLAQVLARQPQFPPLAIGESVTTGTITDAWPVAAGQTWQSDYGALGLRGLELTLS